ncbi:MAG TPA: SAM-dependent methyltransferase [Acidimicrobiales bacterium]
MYRADPDPWRFSTSEYEQRKYALTVAALPRLRYRRAFEPGCSIGVLSDLLANRCDQLLSTDIVPSALELAVSRLCAKKNVTIGCYAIPDQWPEGSFDLVVLSEVAYYFDSSTLDRVVQCVLGSLDIGGHLVGVHWSGDTDYPLTAEQVHHQINGYSQFRRVARYAEDLFILDVWEKDG